MMQFYRDDNEGRQSNIWKFGCSLLALRNHLYIPTEQPITVWCLEGCDWLLHRFVDENFLKLTDYNQIFRNYFVNFQLKLISANFFSHDFLQWTLYNTIYSMMVLAFCRQCNYKCTLCITIYSMMVLAFFRQCNYKCTMCIRNEKLETVKHSKHEPLNYYKWTEGRQIFRP